MKNWTEVEANQAQREGWRLADTIDNGTSYVYLLITPADARFKNSQTAASFVIDQARRGSGFHREALQLMIVSRLRPTRKGER